MEKIIEIDIVDKSDLVEKYNDDRLSKELLEFILKEATFITRKDKVKIVINNKCSALNSVNIIKEGLKDEYAKNLKLWHIMNYKQLFLLVIGLIFLFLSSLIGDAFIWKELLLIGGWVPIWEVVDIELISDIESKRRRIILKQLLNGEVILK